MPNAARGPNRQQVLPRGRFLTGSREGDPGGEQRRERNRLDFEALGQRIHPADSRVRLLAEQTPASFIAFDLLALGDVDTRARDGDPRAVARLITLVESNHPRLPELAAALAPETGTAQVIGLTGAPARRCSRTSTTTTRTVYIRHSSSRPRTKPASAIVKPIALAA
jgi:hypothetical protein